MFLFSTFCGVAGLYILYKFENKILGGILCGIWFVLAVVVRVLIMKDKKYFKNNKV
jgi:ABC-type thiamin/hydroxymethylpyrimidine transport system permease subunit